MSLTRLSTLPSKGSTVHQLKISLRDIRPLIWRRVLVPSKARLADLHDVIQATMPWLDYHMYQFIIDGEEFSRPMPGDADFDRDVRDDRRFSLAQVAPGPGTFLYEYDMGDDWIHVIRVEKVIPVDPAIQYPVCTDGARAAPPDDCGGPWGYDELLKTLANPRHKEHREMKEWAESQVGRPFDPERFDLEETNQRLRRIAKRFQVRRPGKRKAA